jgi:hypothetical protein
VGLSHVLKTLDWHIFGIDRRKPRHPGPDVWAEELEQGVEQMLTEPLEMAQAIAPPYKKQRRRQGEPDSADGGFDWKAAAPRWLLVTLVAVFGSYTSWNAHHRLAKLEEHVEAHSAVLNRISALEVQVALDSQMLRTVRDRQEGVLLREQKRDAQYDEIINRLTRIERVLK